MTKWEHSRHYTVIHLRRLCTWTKVITIRDEGLHLYLGSECKAAKAGGRWACGTENRQMRMDGVTEVRGEDLKCSKHLASQLQCTRKAGLCADFICQMKGCTTVCAIWLSEKPWHNLPEQQALSFAQVSPLWFLLFNLLGNTPPPTPLLNHHQQPIYSHPLPVHLSLWHVVRCVHAWHPLIGNALWMSHFSPSAQQSLTRPSVPSDNES